MNTLPLRWKGKSALPVFVQTSADLLAEQPQFAVVADDADRVVGRALGRGEVQPVPLRAVVRHLVHVELAGAVAGHQEISCPGMPRA
jgi:hypothetical protein